MKLKDIINAQPVLQKLTQKDLPIKTAISLLKLCKDTAVHVEAFEKTKKRLFEKYGREDPQKPGNMVILEENVEAFTNEINFILESDMTLDFDKIDIADFGDDIKLTVSDVNFISWIIT